METYIYGNGRDSCPEGDYDATVIDVAFDRSIGGLSATFALRRSNKGGDDGRAQEVEDISSGGRVGLSTA